MSEGGEVPPAPPLPAGALGPSGREEAARYKSAGRGVSLVVQRCEAAKASGLLDLKGCQLVSLPDAIYLILKEYTIKQLSLAHNQLKKFPRRIPEKFTSLQVLSLKGNAIAEWPEEMEDFPKLQAMDLAGNGLREIPEQLLLQPKLKILNLAENPIAEVDVDVVFTHAQRLQILNLSGCPLSEAVRAEIAASPHADKVKLQ